MENKVVNINKHITDKLIDENFNSYKEVKETIVELIYSWAKYLSYSVENNPDTFIEEYENYLEDMNDDNIKKALENKYETR